MKKYKKILIIIFFVCILFCLTGCSENNDNKLQAKIISELDYVNVKIVDILNKLNNISFDNYSVVSQQVKLNDEEKQSQTGEGSQGSRSQEGQTSESSGENSGKSSGGSSDKKGTEEKQEKEGESQDSVNTTKMVTEPELDKDRKDVDWTQIKQEIELLNESWSIIILDMYALDVKQDSILSFSDKINATLISVKEENKQQSLIAFADLYSEIPVFLEEIGADKNIQKIRQTQSHVINAYILADNIENTEINKNLEQAITTYAEVISNIDYTKDKTQKTNKVYVLLNELNNSLDKKDTDIFYLKYKNFMKEIESI